MLQTYRPVAMSKYRKYKKSYRKYKKYTRYNLATRIRPEQKHLGWQAPVVGFNEIGAVSWLEQDLSTCSQGDGATQRIGRQLAITSIEVNMAWAGGMVDDSGDDIRQTVRVVIGLWNNQSTIPCETINLAFDQPLKKTINTNGNLKKKYLDQYINMYALSPAQGDGYMPQTGLFRYYHRFKKPVYVSYGDDTDDFPDSRLVMSCLSDANSANLPGFKHGYALVQYVDV